MTTSSLQVRCEKCQQMYDVFYSPKMGRLFLSVEFSMCPHCLTPRSPDRFFDPIYRNRCWICKVPFSLLGEGENGLRGLCKTHYYLFVNSQKVHSKETSVTIFHHGQRTQTPQRTRRSIRRN